MKSVARPRFLAAAAVAVGLLGVASAAQARSDVHFSIGLGVPVYSAPAPYYVQPQPVYVDPQPVYVQPQYAAPAEVVVSPGYVYGDDWRRAEWRREQWRREEWRRHHGHRDHDHDRRWD